jgi:hypothetical protein
VLADAHKREYDRFILRATNRSKALWQIIKRESGNGHKINPNTFEAGTMSISNPEFIPYKFNSFFVEVAGKMLNQNKNCKPDYVAVCENTSLSILIFLAPVTEEEVLNVISNLKGELSAGYDKIPEKIVMFGAQSITKPLTFIFNLSL